MAEDALACFSSLLKSVPEWIADLEGMLKAASERQEEMLFADEPAEANETYPREGSESKSSSIRSRPVGPQRTDAIAAQHWSVARLVRSDAASSSQRKRKNASLLSGDHSGPVKSRSKPAMAVFYDGETQKHFERIVRTVGSSRNTIRKAKMSAKVEMLNRRGSSCSDMSSNSEDEEDMCEFSPTKFRLNVKSPRAPRLSYRRDNIECFDKVDSLLEKAQSSIERAAFQVLREGDCTPEVRMAKDQFAQALRLTETETPFFQSQVDKAAERRKRGEDRKQAQELAQLKKSTSRLNPNVINVVTTITHESRLNVDQLEVDSSSDDDDNSEFNMGAIRGKFGPLANMRTARLTAL